MVGRLFCLVAGAALGGYVVHRFNRTVRAWSPAGIANRVEDNVAEYRDALREFNEDVREAMERRESELRGFYTGAVEAPERSATSQHRVVEAIEPPGANNAHDMKDGH